jgi:hypothetical protein
MVSTSLFDDGPEIEFPNEIMCSKFHPTIPNLFLAGSISGHLHWFENNNNNKNGKIYFILIGLKSMMMKLKDL